MKFNITQNTKTNNYFFTLYNTSGKPMFRSREYTRKHDTKRAVHRFFGNMEGHTFTKRTVGRNNWLEVSGRRGLLGKTISYKSKAPLSRIEGILKNSAPDTFYSV